MSATPMDAAGAEPVAFPQPESSDIGTPFWASLKQGKLSFQRCQSCGKAWLPARHQCPGCLSPNWQREESKGQARLISWVVYHVAYHPAFANRLPYTVAVVELDEGPRMITNLIHTEAHSLQLDQRLWLVIEDEQGVAVPRFEPHPPGAGMTAKAQA
jgi:uncharacterized protein